METFDVGRAQRMIAIAAVVGWLLYLLALVIDAVSIDAGSFAGEVWRYRLSSVSAAANPAYVLGLAVALGLSLAKPDRTLTTVFGGIAVVTTLVGLAEIYNVATAGEAMFRASSEGARIAYMTGGVVLSITILAVVKDRLTAFDEDEMRAAIEADEADAAAGDPADPADEAQLVELSSPDENR